MARMTRAAVLRALRDHLEGLSAPVGSRLPPERALAAILGCSRQTLRVCLDMLEAEGLVWRHVGQGTHVGPRPARRAAREPLLIEAAAPREVMEARLLLEPQVAAAAARRAGPEEIRFLHERVHAGQVARDRQGAEQADDAFHRAVAQVAGNPILIGVLTYLSGARRRIAWQQEWDRTYRRIGVAEFRSLHSRQHLAVVEAIGQGDPGGAEAAMRHHLQTIHAAISGAGTAAPPLGMRGQ